MDDLASDVLYHAEMVHLCNIVVCPVDLFATRKETGRSRKMKALLVFISLLIGNVVAQYLNVDPSYIVAIERSYFQGWALLVYCAMNKFVWGE